MWADLQLPADLVIFAEKTFNENFIFCTVLFQIATVLI